MKSQTRQTICKQETDCNENKQEYPLCAAVAAFSLTPLYPRCPENHRVPGSPGATVTIDGKQIRPHDAVWRRDQGKRPGFQAILAAARRAAQGAPNILSS